MQQVFQIRKELPVLMSCNILKRLWCAHNSVWKSRSPACLLWKQKHPSKRSIQSQRKEVPLLTWISVSMSFLSEGKHYQMHMWGPQRKTALKPSRVLVCVLWKIHHFVSTNQHWLHNKSSYCAEQLSRFIERKQIYCYSCEYHRVCFGTWNTIPGFIQKEEEIEQRLGEMNVIMAERFNKLWCTILHTISSSLLLYPIFFLQWSYSSLIKNVVNVGAKPTSTHKTFDLLKTVFPWSYYLPHTFLEINLFLWY